MLIGPLTFGLVPFVKPNVWNLNKMVRISDIVWNQNCLVMGQLWIVPKSERLNFRCLLYFTTADAQKLDLSVIWTNRCPDFSTELDHIWLSYLKHSSFFCRFQTNVIFHKGCQDYRTCLGFRHLLYMLKTLWSSSFCP